MFVKIIFLFQIRNRRVAISLELCPGQRERRAGAASARASGGTRQAGRVPATSGEAGASHQAAAGQNAPGPQEGQSQSGRQPAFSNLKINIFGLEKILTSLRLCAW